MCQISHMGRRTRWDAGNWLVPVAPSPVREPEHRSFPKAMEDWDFARIIRDFGQAARRCKEGGLDGVELSFQTLHLVPQFWSPSANKRTDQYGGSLDNRMRFSMEVLEEVRRQVGPDFIVERPHDRRRADRRRARRQGMPGDRRAAGEIGHGRCPQRLGGPGAATGARSSVVMANMAFPVAPFLHLASAVKARGRHPHHPCPAHQRHGHGGARGGGGPCRSDRPDPPHMADPHIVRKLLEGRPDDIRQCVGANYCIDRIYVGGEALCIQNPATGREAHHAS